VGAWGRSNLGSSKGEGGCARYRLYPSGAKGARRGQTETALRTHNFEFASILSLVAADRVESLKSPNYHYLIYLAIVDQVKVSERLLLDGICLSSLFSSLITLRRGAAITLENPFDLPSSHHLSFKY
jgi:hypothetical protein